MRLPVIRSSEFHREYVWSGPKYHNNNITRIILAFRLGDDFAGKYDPAQRSGDFMRHSLLVLT